MRFLSRCSVALLCCVMAAGVLRAQEDGWSSLTSARAEFERAAWQADFVQTYIPSGFSSGERETGRLAVTLPGQLRWDYSVPYEKVFLISGTQAFTWNPGETMGRRALLEPAEREHLALLELDVAELRRRYSAAVEARSAEAIEIVLTPLADDIDIRSARIVLDASSYRIEALAYADLEGNTTRFDLSGHRIVADEGIFEPPVELDWLDN